MIEVCEHCNVMLARRDRVVQAMRPEPVQLETGERTKMDGSVVFVLESHWVDGNGRWREMARGALSDFRPSAD